MLTPIRQTGCIFILLFSACILSAQVERGTISGTVHDAPGVVNFDFSAFKSFPITEAKSVEFRSEWFNAKPSRQIQMVLKFLF